METPEQFRVIIARHEAAHAVAAIMLDHWFEYVTIVPEGQIAGRVHFPDSADDAPTPKHARESAIIHLAAQVDARLHKSRSTSFIDMVHAEDILQQAHPDLLSMRQLMDEAWGATHVLMERPAVQGAISTLAEALLSEGTIQAEQATEMVQATLRTQQAFTQSEAQHES
jgi:hypothetical protein